MAEDYPNVSPYVYCLNNPIKFTDPDGRSVEGDDTFIFKDKNGKVTNTQVVNTGDTTPNRLFVQDASANKNTENRKAHNGAYFEQQMIPSSSYSEADYKAQGFMGSSQFDKDRNSYVFEAGDYSDKNMAQRLGNSMSDDLVTQSDLTILLMPRGGKDPGGAVGTEEKAIQYSYAPRVRARGVEDPTSHNFPYSFDKHILETNAIPKNNGYNIYQLPGSMNGKNGVFEIGVNNKNIIDHRFFRPTK